MKTGFIGCGNMAKAIIKGIADKGIEHSCIYAYDIDGAKTKELSEELGINASASVDELVSACQVIVMAVKPNLMNHALSGIKSVLSPTKHVVVSIAAGINIEMLEGFAGIENLPIIRVMPNINVTVSQGMAAVCRNQYVMDEQYEFILSLFAKTGKAMELDEKFFPIFGALAGSSPAFSYLFIESLAKSAHKAGLPKDKALEIAAQAVLGSAAMLLESKAHPWQLIDSVCSPGGTTIEGICTLEETGFQTSVVKCLDACMAKDAVITERNRTK